MASTAGRIVFIPAVPSVPSSTVGSFLNWRSRG